jgi:hypothetical protein
MSPKSKPAKKQPAKHHAAPAPRHSPKGAEMTDPMIVDPQPEEPEPQAEPPQATAVNAPDPLGLLKELPPDYATKLKPNDRVRILTKDGQDDVTYPIGGEPAPEPEPPPTGEPTETATVQWDVAETDTDIALTPPAPLLTVGSVFLIDTEYMTVVDVSNADNPGVTRATHGSTVATHTAGAQVSIWEA